MAWNCQTGPKKVDIGGVAESLQVSEIRQSLEGMALRTNRFVDGKFFTCVNPKDGYVVSKCKDVRARQVLEFLVPILYPEKPTLMTITIGNTIFGALFEERLID